MRSDSSANWCSVLFADDDALYMGHLSTGGLYINEHPAPPHDPSIASTWTAPWTQVQHPDVALHVVNQWRWGCEATKLTGLMSLRFPKFLSSMCSRALDDAKPPTVTAIGLGAGWTFPYQQFERIPHGILFSNSDR